MASPHQGLFVWHDLMTTDPGKAASFYGSLFDWQMKDEKLGDGTYTMIMNSGRGIGGMNAHDPARGGPSHWMCHVLVGDIEATVRETKRLGGAIVLPATEIPGVGWFAVLKDPQGAHISTFQERPGSPEDWELPMGPGTFCWHELLARDPGRAIEFYCGLFGWTHSQQEMGELGTYHMFHRGDAFAGGMLAMPAGSDGPSAWLPYVYVTDLERAVAQTTRLGGQVCVPPTIVPGVGHFAVATDPTGAYFAHFSE
ncbi:MAG: VOC family protein [Acidobacteria bacterium]|nr:VOC family protein [Acidobacteriota bacterium]